MKQIPGPYRQGHILLVWQKKLSKTVRPAEFTPGHVVIARGETGREHVFTSDRVSLFQDLDGGLFIKVINSAVLEHEEHDDIEVEPGIWRVVEQREEDPENMVARRSFPD